MAMLVDVTGLQPVKVTAVDQMQNLWDAVDVLEYDILDLELGVVQLSATSVTISLMTSLQKDLDDESWRTVFSYTAVSTAPGYEIKSQTGGFLRYLRWKVTAWSGTGSAYFWIRGVGRKHG